MSVPADAALNLVVVLKDRRFIGRHIPDGVVVSSMRCKPLPVSWACP